MAKGPKVSTHIMSLFLSLLKARYDIILSYMNFYYQSLEESSCRVLQSHVESYRFLRTFADRCRVFSLVMLDPFSSSLVRPNILVAEHKDNGIRYTSIFACPDLNHYKI